MIIHYSGENVHTYFLEDFIELIVLEPNQKPMIAANREIVYSSQILGRASSRAMPLLIIM